MSKTEVNESLAQLNTQWHPIDTIPPEILLLIFEEYCRFQSPLESADSNECRVTQICRYWRTLSLNLPTLWTKVNVSSRTPLAIVSVYLQRSRDLPLALELDLRHDPADEAMHQHIVQLWEVIRPTIRRWRQVQIHLTPQDTVFEDMRSVATPFLEDIQVTCDAPANGSGIPVLECQLPALKHLSLSNVPLQNFSLSLGNLTYLELTSNSPMEFPAFRAFLNQMDKLEDLTLRSRVVEGWPVYPTSEEMITMASLKTLNLSDRRWPLFVPLLSISAPILHSLSLFDLVGHDLPETFVEHRITAQYPSVRNLTLTGKSSFVDEVSFTQLARMFPVVDHLALLDVDATFTVESCRNLHEPALWPKLQTLSMTPMVSEGVLCSLISVRAASPQAVGLQRLVGPMPIRFKRMEWISQRVQFEKCQEANGSGVGLDA